MTHFLPVLHLMTSALRRHLDSDEVPVGDPGDHPALRRLPPRELADLPFPRSAGQAGGDRLGEREPQTPEPDDLRPAA